MWIDVAVGTGGEYYSSLDLLPAAAIFLAEWFWSREAAMDNSPGW
jgi:hypothetical protein